MCGNTVDEQVIPSCGTILSHFRSGWRGHLLTYRGLSSQNECPKKMWLPSFDLFDLRRPLDLLTSAHHLFPLPPTSPFSSKCPFLDNTFNMKMENDTHVHSKTTSTRERIVLYLLWVRNTPVFFFVVVFLYAWTSAHFFYIPGCFILLLCITSVKAGLRGQGEGLLREGSECDVSVTGLRPTSLKHTCMQTSNPHQDWWGTHGI